MPGHTQCEHVVTIRVVPTPLLGVARTGQVFLMAEKLPEKQVQHFVQQQGRAVERVRGAPEWRAQGNRIPRERDEGSWCLARDNERGEGAARIGGSRTADVRHARAKAVGHCAEAIGDRSAAGRSFAHGTGRDGSPKKNRNKRRASLSRVVSLAAAFSANEIAP